MPSKSEVIASISKELRIVAHLTGKLEESHLMFRFTPAQRSTRELLEYLATTAEGAVRFLLTGTREGGKERRKQTEALSLSAFPEAFAQQAKTVETLLEPVSEEEFATRKVRNGQGVELPLGEALFEGIVKQLVGYKTQLFLQAKAAGVSSLATANLWRGEDPS